MINVNEGLTDELPEQKDDEKKEIFKGNLQRKKEKKQSKDDNLKNED
jgi:hypothetical protein